MRMSQTKDFSQILTVNHLKWLSRESMRRMSQTTFEVPAAPGCDRKALRRRYDSLFSDGLSKGVAIHRPSSP